MRRKPEKGSYEACLRAVLMDKARFTALEGKSLKSDAMKKRSESISRFVQRRRAEGTHTMPEVVAQEAGQGRIPVRLDDKTVVFRKPVNVKS